MGEAVITAAGKLPAKFVIHAVGPVWNDGNSNEEELLSCAYVNSLKLAAAHQVRTIAFPNISTGIYRFPKQTAAHIAIEAVNTFLATNDTIEKVMFVCFDVENLRIYESILNNK